ncbi:MAG: DNA-binding protein [Bacteroidetes bacterium CG18_big_fil_WC_8_21_14_2_50_41_14]|nr:MAG: DNA-binding protein [Bacteroidetes bacterium CG18_big_fil_WC_8_21_14_2_50_41_14]PIY33511.1 MAG: DNA-binding protein [Bacteroidetes bacterium CG_4_10_14_3_um_filter_42_6]PJB57922.1 MAG: DNA-binding protein [Bacteroidetes bacterium CG_4_9_14_3_um_filter_41_19]
MSNTSKAVTAREAAIASRIIAIREENVILDVHIAEFYGIETRTLKQAVRRNRDRFPDDFLYELTGDEINSVVSQNVIPSKRHFGGAVPFAFTENGVAMLSSILNSKQAIEINIAIMRTFTMLRKALLLQKDIMSEMGNVKRKLIEHDEKILVIFEYLKQVEKSGQQQLDQSNRKRIGYIRSDE